MVIIFLTFAVPVQKVGPLLEEDLAPSAPPSPQIFEVKGPILKHLKILKT